MQLMPLFFIFQSILKVALLVFILSVIIDLLYSVTRSLVLPLFAFALVSEVLFSESADDWNRFTLYWEQITELGEKVGLDIDEADSILEGVFAGESVTVTRRSCDSSCVSEALANGEVQYKFVKGIQMHQYTYWLSPETLNKLWKDESSALPFTDNFSNGYLVVYTTTKKIGKEGSKLKDFLYEYETKRWVSKQARKRARHERRRLREESKESEK